MSLSERTKRRQVKAKVDEHMEFCRQLNSNNENSSSCSTLATIQIPLEQDIPESDPHHDCTFISTETQCAGLVPQSVPVHHISTRPYSFLPVQMTGGRVST